MFAQINKSLAVTIIFVLAFPVLPQTNSNSCAPAIVTDWQKDNLRGKVKEFRVFKTWFKKDDETRKLVEGERRLEEEASYDSSGKRTAFRNTNYLPSNPADALTVSRVYGVNNKVVEIKVIRADGSMLKRITYSYDTKGNVIEKADYFSDGTLERSEKYSLDRNGHMIEEVSKQQIHPEHFNPKRYDAYVTTKRSFKRDSLGNAIEEKHFYPDGSLYGTWARSYDSSGQLTRVFRTDKENRPEELKTYTYRSDGQLAEVLHYFNFCMNRDGTFCEGTLKTDAGVFYYGTRTIYQNDSQGNWVTEIEYTIYETNGIKSFEPSSTFYREITYY